MRQITMKLSSTLLAATLAVTALHAQTKSPAAAKTADFALMYSAERSNYSFGSSIWLQGGSLEAAVPVAITPAARVPVLNRISLVGNLTGLNTGGKNGGTTFSTVDFTFGPRYALEAHGYHLPSSRVFAEALFGGVHGFDATFPTPTGPARSFNAFAMQLGGGYDVDLPHHFAVRAIDLHYVQTHLPNGTSNKQNDFRIGAGIVYRLPAR